MLSRSFKAGKCKTSLKLAVARMKLLKNKREVQLRQMKRDLAQLLESDQEQTARIRVEHVVREEKTMAAYDIIELYCELIVARLPIIESQKNCPIDLKEAITSVIFASPRCADLPELQDIRKHFTTKYGKEFVASALELRPDCGVSRTVVEKLSAKTPDGETKIKILTAIAQEHNVKWDPRAFQEEITKPSEDLLKVPSMPENASKTFVESSGPQHQDPNTHIQSPNAQYKSANEQFLARPGQRHDPLSKLSGGLRSSPGSDTFFSVNSSTPSFSVPSISYSREKFSETEVNNRESRPSTIIGENVTFNGHNWTMKFKDATSAAQAAAESAELASIAARAAAELSSQGKVTSNPSRESHEQAFFVTRDGVSSTTYGRNPRSDSVKNSSKMNEDSEFYHVGQRPKDDRQRDETNRHDLRHEAESRYDDRRKSDRSLRDSGSSDGASSTTYGRNPRSNSVKRSSKMNEDSEFYHVGQRPKDDRQRDETNRHNLSHEAESRYDERRNIDRSLRDSGTSPSAKVFSDDEVSVSNFQKTEEIFRDAKSESIRKDSGYLDPNMDFVGVNSNSGHHIKDYGNVPFRDSSLDPSVQMIFGTSFKNPPLSDYSSVVFDDSGSEAGDKVELEDVDRTNSFPARIPLDGRKSVSRRDSWSYTESSTSPLRHKPNDRTQSSIEDKRSTETSVEVLEISDQSQPNDILPATFDDSDGPSSSSDNEVDDHKFGERNKNSNSPHRLDTSYGNTTSAWTPRESIMSPHTNRETKETKRNMYRSHSSDDSGSDDGNSKNLEAEQEVVKSSRKHSLGYLPSELPSLDNTKISVHPAIEERQPVTLSSFPSAEGKDKAFGTLRDAFSHNEVKDDVKVLNTSSDDSEITLNFGRLTGGLRHKGFSQPPYVRHSSAQGTADRNPNNEKQSVDFGGKTSNYFETPDSQLSSEKTRKEALQESKAKKAFTYFGSDSSDDDNDRDEAHKNVGSKVYGGGMLSRRTRADPLKTEVGSPLRFNSDSHRHFENFGDGNNASEHKTTVVRPKVGDIKLREAKRAMEQSSNPPPPIEIPSQRIKEPVKPQPEIPQKGSPLRFNSDSHRQFENFGDGNNASEHKTTVVRPKVGDIKLREAKRAMEQSSNPPPPIEIPSQRIKEPVKPQPEIPQKGSRESLKPASLQGGSIARDNSLKMPSHVHPKLPDYNTLAARIQSLRSNQQ